MAKMATNRDFLKDINQYRGCLIGFAAGDALGYPVETMTEAQISRVYGAHGITRYHLKGGVAQISASTQMMLFTATGLLNGATRGIIRGIQGAYEGYTRCCYQDWLKTQILAFAQLQDGQYHYSWLIDVPEMFNVRSPGKTCVCALIDSQPGSLQPAINTSKGCGGMLPIAPIGLYREASLRSDVLLDTIGAKTAELTHGHELGCIPAAAFVHIIDKITHEGMGIGQAVDDAITAIPELFPECRHMGEFRAIMSRAVALAAAHHADEDDLAAIHTLGSGWVAEETLAIAVYCALRYPDDFQKAVHAAVNHSGNSNATGAVTGSIVGASVGFSGIPRTFVDDLELRQVILTVADDLYHDCPEALVKSQYEPMTDKQAVWWETKYFGNTLHPQFRQ